MTEEIITKRSSSVVAFFAKARELTEMIESLSKNIRPALNGQSFIDDKELAQRLSLYTVELSKTSATTTSSHTTKSEAK